MKINKDKLSKLTLSWFKEQDITVTPEGFSVMFAYFSKQHKELTEYLDDNLEKNKSNVLFLEYCYFRFLDNTALTSYFSDIIDSLSEKTKAKKDNLSSNIIDFINNLTEELENTKKELEKVRKESETDYLTGLYNRRKFESEVKKILKNDPDRKYNYFLVLTDLDNFKQINDKFGHIIGDAVLVKFSSVIKHNIENIPVIASRIGGEEFALFLKSEQKHAFLLCEKIRNEISAFAFKNTKTGEVIGKITSSFGYSKLENSDNCWTDIYDKTDKALYEAKKTGKNKTVFYEK